MLLLKTSSDRLAALEARLHELHNYETPEFLVLEIEAGSHVLKIVSGFMALRLLRRRSSKKPPPSTRSPPI